MATTISRGGVTAAPHTLTGYSVSRPSANLIHTIIGRPDPDVTLKPAGLRTGTLEMLCLTLSNALALEALHVGDGIVHLADTDRPELAMYYVPSGSIEVALDDETRDLWLVRIEYQEVLP